MSLIIEISLRTISILFYFTLSIFQIL
uniref:Uncharacterized protein n=1 Tax=Rhizophora mucronata TaxID=61149 RepID=A0A2P2P1N1_RHIMU